jgi:hypothetical protein
MSRVKTPENNSVPEPEIKKYCHEASLDSKDFLRPQGAGQPLTIQTVRSGSISRIKFQYPNGNTVMILLCWTSISRNGTFLFEDAILCVVLPDPNKPGINAESSVTGTKKLRHGVFHTFKHRFVM